MPGHLSLHLLSSDLLSDREVVRYQGLMAQAGLAPASLLQPYAQVPMRWLQAACDNLDAERAACLGFYAGAQARLTSYSALSLPLVSASSVAEVLNLLHFMPLLSNVFHATFHETDSAVVILLAVDSGDPVLDRIPVFYCASALRCLLQLLSGQDLPLTTHLAWPCPAGLQTHPDVLSGRLRFDAPMHWIQVPRAALASVCRFSDPIVYAGAVAELTARLQQQVQADDVAARLRRRLQNAGTWLPLEALADELHLSPSTLKRRLAEAGTSYSRLLSEVLSAQARLLLSDRNLSLEAVASRLGYSDLANFSHAFRRWTGWTPGAFRRSL